MSYKMDLEMSMNYSMIFSYPLEVNFESFI